MTSYVFRNASTIRGDLIDLSICDDHFATTSSPDAQIIDLDRRLVLPGFVDHHVHLMAQAAVLRSIDLSPALLNSSGGLAAVLGDARRSQPDGWLRAIGYDWTASGPINRRVLDGIKVGPLRVQDRTGSLWAFDSAGLALILPENQSDWPEGIERDSAGHPTGVARRLDGWLRTRLVADNPDLESVGRYLAELGVTSVTDATATNGQEELSLLASANLPQRVTAMTERPDVTPFAKVAIGPVKIILDEIDLPSRDELMVRVAKAHRFGRNVAVHCVDEASLVLALASGVGRGDRIEHAALMSDSLLGLVVKSGVTVVTQPGLIALRGDRYLEELDSSDHPHLYRLASLVAEGIDVKLSSDAPFGPIDPWTTLQAAVTRTTSSGNTIGEHEAVDVFTAMRLMTDEPTRSHSMVPFAPGNPADFIVIDSEFAALQRNLFLHPKVLLTVIAGSIAHCDLPGMSNESSDRTRTSKF